MGRDKKNSLLSWVQFAYSFEIFKSGLLMCNLQTCDLLWSMDWLYVLWFDSNTLPPPNTGTCFIQKIYAPSSSLLQGKHLPFTPSPLRLNIFRLFVIIRWPNYIVTLPRYFSFRLPHLNINTGPPQTNWTRIFSESRIFYFSVNETDTTTSGLR